VTYSRKPSAVRELPVIVKREPHRPLREPARPGPLRPAKKLVRRIRLDYSQPLRRLVQWLFFTMNVVLGLKFWLYVRHFESGAPAVPRPAGVEGWLPIAGLMNLKYFLVTGAIPGVHSAAMILIVAFLAISVVFRKAFCGWLCPIGTLSEGLWKLGRRWMGSNWMMPRWLDLPLRVLKYLLLSFFLYAVASLSAVSIMAFMQTPYGLIADVKMLDFFRHLSRTAAITLAVLALLSMVYQNFWCRYLCPYGALMGLAALVSPTRVRRERDRCIDCARCARACPALLPVDKLDAVRSAECTACLECVAVCPAAAALELDFGGRRPVPAWVLAAGIALLFGAIVGYAQWAGWWQTDIPDAVYRELIPHSREVGHPGL
jgi:polyferredoxin